MIINYLKKTLWVAVLSSAAMLAFAEDAPVYDVDSYPAQFDGQQASTDDPAAALGPQHSTATKPDSGKMLAANDDTQTPPPPLPSTKSLTTEQRLARLEQQLNNSMNSDVNSKVTDLQTEIQSLRGQLDEMSHQVQLLQAQQKNLSLDVNKHLVQEASNTSDKENTSAATTSAKDKKSKVSDSSDDSDKENGNNTGLPSTNTSSTGSSSDQPNVAEEQQIYQSAYNYIKAKKYSDAAATLQKMLQKYPSGQFAANAHYWLGELYGLMGKNDQSVAEFAQVVKNYPESPKIADAQLKLGLIYAAQLKWPDAKTAFKKVINHYPGTSSAHLASEQLKQIKQAGH